MNRHGIDYSKWDKIKISDSDEDHEDSPNHLHSLNNPHPDQRQKVQPSVSTFARPSTVVIGPSGYSVHPADNRPKCETSTPESGHEIKSHACCEQISAIRDNRCNASVTEPQIQCQALVARQDHEGNGNNSIRHEATPGRGEPRAQHKRQRSWGRVRNGRWVPPQPHGGSNGCPVWTGRGYGWGQSQTEVHLTILLKSIAELKGDEEIITKGNDTKKNCHDESEEAFCLEREKHWLQQSCKVITAALPSLCKGGLHYDDVARRLSFAVQYSDKCAHNNSNGTLADSEPRIHCYEGTLAYAIAHNGSEEAMEELNASWEQLILSRAEVVGTHEDDEKYRLGASNATRTEEGATTGEPGASPHPPLLTDYQPPRLGKYLSITLQKQSLPLSAVHWWGHCLLSDKASDQTKADAAAGVDCAHHFVDHGQTQMEEYVVDDFPDRSERSREKSAAMEKVWAEAHAEFLANRKNERSKLQESVQDS